MPAHFDDYDDLDEIRTAKRPTPAFAPAVDQIRKRDGDLAAAEVEAAAKADDRGAPQGNQNAAGKRPAPVRGFWADEKERYALLSKPGNAYAKRGWRLSNGFVASYNGALVAHTTTGIGALPAHAVVLPNGRRFTFRSAKAAFDFVERHA
ncbi:hypothetical protein [uncultured Arthrobacter sp.]|uniref:hypothetical protein n=1 Tax=uncultured Arthrobacter sp. TaxID=114050 RepID=UPI0032178A80